MPAKSTAQRRWAFGVKGEAWAKTHGYDNPGPLPARAGKKKPKKKKGATVKKKAKKKAGKKSMKKKAGMKMKKPKAIKY